jgi:hypothetical protein
MQAPASTTVSAGATEGGTQHAVSPTEVHEMFDRTQLYVAAALLGAFELVVVIARTVVL